MNKYSRVLTFSLFSWTTIVTAQTAETKGALDKHWWVQAATGYDYAVIGGDVINGQKAWVDMLQLAGRTPATSKGNSGIRAGGEVGYLLDENDALSVDCENIWTQTQSWTYTYSGVTNTQSLSPGLFNVTLNYQRFLSVGKGQRFYAVIGGGYYHASVDYYMGIDPANSTTGTFTCDSLGGALGVGQELAIGDTFGLDLSIKGRLATFSRLTSSSLVDNGRTITQNAPYALMILTGFGPDAIQGGSPGFLGNQARYAVLDYSGIEGNVALGFYF